MEAYLGKDYAQAVDLMENEQNQVFGFQESLKKLFPDKTPYLKMPKVREEQEKLKQYMGYNKVDGESIDPRMAGFLQSTEYGDKLLANIMKNADTPHPTDPKRTKFGDMRAMIEKLEAKMAAQGEENAFFQKDMKQIVHFLEENYKDFDETFETPEEGQAKVAQLLEEYKQKLAEYEAEVLKEGNMVRELMKDSTLAKSKEFDAAFEDLYNSGDERVAAASDDNVEDEDGEHVEEDVEITPENAAEVLAEGYARLMKEEYDEEVDDPLSAVSYQEGELVAPQDLSDEETAKYDVDRLLDFSTDQEFQADVTDLRRRYARMDEKHGTNFLKQFDEQFRKDYLEAVQPDEEELLQA